VAVKIQRPNIRAVIDTDLEILRELAMLAELRLEWTAKYQIQEMVDEFAKSIRSELDYTIEGRNAERISKPFENDPYIRIPGVYWDYSTQNVLTMEYMEGTKLNDIIKSNDERFHRRLLAKRLIRASLQQILIDGFFHADPHPGNILTLPGNVIVFMDFGMLGRLSPEMKDHAASFVIALMRQNANGVMKAMIQMRLVVDDVDLAKLRLNVDELKAKYYDVLLSQVNLGEAVNDLFAVAFEHNIRVPADLTLLGKTLLIIEETVEQLDPELSILKVAKPFGYKLLKERFHPKTMAENLLTSLMEYGELLNQLPKHLQELATAVKKGKTQMERRYPITIRY